MFDFQKLEVYHKAMELNKDIALLTRNSSFDRTTNDQLRRASFSVLLNLAEGSSRFSNNDRRHFLVISRGSAFECVAILEFLMENLEIPRDVYLKFYAQIEEISKMLFALIKKMNWKFLS